MANAVVTKTGYIKRVTPQRVIGQQLLEIEKEKLKLKQNKSTQDQNVAACKTTNSTRQVKLPYASPENTFPYGLSP